MQQANFDFQNDNSNSVPVSQVETAGENWFQITAASKDVNYVHTPPQVKEIWLARTPWQRSRWSRPMPTSRPWPTVTYSTSVSKASARSSDSTPSTPRSSSARYNTTSRTIYERATGPMWVHTVMYSRKKINTTKSRVVKQLFVCFCANQGP